jgi:hypothetical protein
VEAELPTDRQAPDPDQPQDAFLFGVQEIRILDDHLFDCLQYAGNEVVRVTLGFLGLNSNATKYSDAVCLRGGLILPRYLVPLPGENIRPILAPIRDAKITAASNQSKNVSTLPTQLHHHSGIARVFQIL